MDALTTDKSVEALEVEAHEKGLTALTDVQLAFVGGGIADVIGV